MQYLLEYEAKEHSPLISACDSLASAFGKRLISGRFKWCGLLSEYEWLVLSLMLKADC
jgi:hypothetical protein